MRRIVTIFAALGLLFMTACYRPELISSEQLSRPHVVSIIETDPKVIVDPGKPAPASNNSAMAGAGAGAPLIAVAVGALVAGAMQGVEAGRAGVRQTRAQALQDELGPTGELGTELQREFRAALASEIARGTRMPIQRIESRPGNWRMAPQDETQLNLRLGALLTQDARSLTVQLWISQVTLKPGEQRPTWLNSYDFVAFSSPIEATSEEEAVRLWRQNNYARLRQAMRALTPEIMTLLRMALFDVAPADIGNAPWVSTKMPGFSLVSHGRANIVYRDTTGRSQTNFHPGVSGPLLRRTPDRAYLVMHNFAVDPLRPGHIDYIRPGWAWVSVPAGSL
jgi:hypothetical protein